jgi:glycosyltransferase involved in cell wall biosynthesis
MECSVVIPTRDRPGQLDTCLEALACQSLPRDRFEVIVVDDGSRAPVAPRLDAWRGRLNLGHAWTPGAGPAAARDAGVALAAGRCLAFTDDDCRPSPEWLQAMLGVLRRRPGTLAGGRTVNVLTDLATSETSQVISEVVHDYYNADPEHARFFSSNNLAAEAGAFRELGGFDPAFRTSEDRDLCHRWLASGRTLIYVPDALVGHAHRLGLAGFWRQHFNYGRGACRHLRAVRTRAAEGSTIELGFYAGLAPRIARRLRGRRRKAAVCALLVAWQAANSAGFLREWLAGRPAPRRRLT